MLDIPLPIRDFLTARYYSGEHNALRHIMAQPWEQWVTRYLGEEGAQRCLIGHYMSRQTAGPITGKGLVAQHWDGWAEEVGIPLAVHLVQQFCGRLLAGPGK